MVKRLSWPVILLGVPVLAGCSATVDHPSLAPRAIERFTVAEPPAPPPAPTRLPDDASRQDRAATLAIEARDADARFRQRLIEAESSVSGGAGAAPGSESWVQAQQAISAAEASREPVTRSLADLDTLQIGAVEAGIGTEAESSLASTIQEIEGIDAVESRALSTLKGRLQAP